MLVLTVLMISKYSRRNATRYEGRTQGRAHLFCLPVAPTGVSAMIFL